MPFILLMAVSGLVINSEGDRSGSTPRHSLTDRSDQDAGSAVASLTASS